MNKTEQLAEIAWEQGRLMHERGTVLISSENSKKISVGIQLLKEARSALEASLEVVSGASNVSIWLKHIPDFDFWPVNTFYGAYLDWCDSEGVEPCGKHVFNTECEKLGLERDRRYINGVKVRCWVKGALAIKGSVVLALVDEHRRLNGIKDGKEIDMKSSIDKEFE